jgi:hypothetical protein
VPRIPAPNPGITGVRGFRVGTCPMLPPFSRTVQCALLGALIIGGLAWVLLDVPPNQVGAAVAPADACPCPRPRVDPAVVPALGDDPGARDITVSRRERFSGMTAELRDWHSAGRPGDLRADFQAATLAIRDLGNAGGVTRLR